jgi:hypothetical protein
MKHLRNRILRHVRVRAGDLVPHELNPRVHTDVQRRALEQLYEEIGFARSLLAYPLPDGRLKLIDGHLRASMTPDEELDVEVVDVNDAEARALLLAIDPLAQLAGYDPAVLEELRETTESKYASAKMLMQVLGEANQRTRRELNKLGESAETPERFCVLIECDDEEQQRELLERFKNEGLKCEAKLA